MIANVTQAATCCYCVQDIGPEGPAELVFTVIIFILTFILVGVVVAIAIMHLRSLFGGADP